MSEEATNSTQPVNESVELSPDANESAQTLSFDELDQLTDGRSGEELLSEAKNQSKGEENKSEPKEESSGEEIEVKSEEAEEKIEEIKKLIAKYGDEEMEIAANSIFRHKVDGEEVDVELQELLNNYSGKVSYDKKFQEFSSEKKEFEGYRDDYDTQIQQINSYINNFADKLKQNDALGALEYFAQFSGMKPHEFRRELLNQLTPEIQRRNGLSSEQLQAEELQAQNEYLQQQQESAQQRSQEQQALQELELEIANVQEAHGISDEAFRDAYDELVDSEYEGDITPQAVAEYFKHSEAFSRADDVLNSINPSLADQDQVVESLQQVIVENPSFDNDDLKEIVEEVYSDILKKTSKTVSKKAVEPKKQETKISKKQESYVDWDDL